MDPQTVIQSPAGSCLGFRRPLAWDPRQSKTTAALLAIDESVGSITMVNAHTLIRYRIDCSLKLSQAQTIRGIDHKSPFPL